MKRKMFGSVSTQGSLKVKRHDVVITKPKEIISDDEEDVVICSHFTLEEMSKIDLPEEDVEEKILSLEDGGESTIHELKKVNLCTVEKPRPTFISA